MTPNLIVRTFSNDQFYWDNVFFSNKYKLKGFKENGKVYLDIGAHAGSFSFSALLLGAKKVFAVEPFIDNYNILLQNIYNPHFAGRIVPYNCGVIYKEPKLGLFSSPELIDKFYFNFGNIKLINNTGIQSYYPCYCVPLDEILQRYCFNENIDILKINIGSFERELLLESFLLNKKVISICGEAEFDNEEDLIKFKKELVIQTYINFYSLPLQNNGRTQFWASKLALSENFNIQT